MNTNSFSLLGVLAGMTLFSHTAVAACPGVFGAPGVNCNGSTGGNVCVMNSSTDIDCDVGKGININSGADAWFVSPSSTSFRAYGYEGDGQAFCCEFSGLTDGCSGGNPISVVIYGVDYGDDLRLMDTTANLWMDCSTTEVYADAGDDFVGGSPATTNNDYLYGQDDADVIHGLGGDDLVYGGYGDDTLCGEGGDDFIWGDYGVDRIKAGAGEDHAYGGDGDVDKVCGGDDADWVYGGDGPGDEVCGEGDTDNGNSGGVGADDNCEPDNYDPVSCEACTQDDCAW